jgi:hypothetical protein
MRRIQLENLKGISPQFVQEYNATIQQELFALPISPIKVATLNGMELYSSKNLKNKYIKAMYKISKVKPVAPDIERLIDQNKVVPCWINKGIFRLAVFKKLAPYSDQGIAGFFTPKTKQVFILMDNNIKWGFAKDKILSDLMLHELMHMASDKFKNNFMSIFSTEFIKYYNALFSEIFKTGDNNITDESKIITRYLFKNFEYKDSTSSEIEKYIKLVSQLLRTKSLLSTERFNSVLTDFYHYIKLYFQDLNSLHNQIRKFQHIYSGLTKGYINGLDVVNNMSFCSQELFYPSEIIAMYIELYKGSPSKPFSIIKKL